MAVSKRLRYEILRRDNHACRYCGATAPEAALTVDHVTPVTLGGTDNPDNLVAACKDCNAGKSASSPDQPVVDDVSAAALRWSAAIGRAAEVLLSDHDQRTALRNQFLEAWNSWTYGSQKNRQTFDLPYSWATSVDNILAAGLPIAILCECVDLAMAQKYVKEPFAYMCGIAWRKVDEIRQIAEYLVEADPSEDDF